MLVDVCTRKYVHYIWNLHSMLCVLCAGSRGECMRARPEAALQQSRVSVRVHKGASHLEEGSRVRLRPV